MNFHEVRVLPFTLTPSHDQIRQSELALDRSTSQRFDTDGYSRFPFHLSYQMRLDEALDALPLPPRYEYGGGREAGPAREEVEVGGDPVVEERRDHGGRGAAPGEMQPAGRLEKRTPPGAVARASSRGQRRVLARAV